MKLDERIKKHNSESIKNQSSLFILFNGKNKQKNVHIWKNLSL